MNWDYLICFTIGLIIGATLLGALLWGGVTESGARCNGCDSDDRRPRSADSPNRECDSPDQSQTHQRAECKAQNVEVCDGGRKASELKQDANRHSQH